MCANKIVENLARRAFRSPVTAEDVSPLMAFYKKGYVTGGFDGVTFFCRLGRLGITEAATRTVHGQCELF